MLYDFIYDENNNINIIDYIYINIIKNRSLYEFFQIQYNEMV